MKKFIIIVSLLALTVVPTLAEDTVVNNSVIEDSIVEDSIPENIVYPYISITPKELMDETKASELILQDLQDNKIGNPLTPSKFRELKKKVTEEQQIEQLDQVTVKCAEINKGYYLKVSLYLDGLYFNLGYFELYNPHTSELICKIRITSPPFKGMGDIVSSGLKKLSKEIKNTLPELIIE